MQITTLTTDPRVCTLVVEHDQETELEAPLERFKQVINGFGELSFSAVRAKLSPGYQTMITVNINFGADEPLSEAAQGLFRDLTTQWIGQAPSSSEAAPPAAPSGELVRTGRVAITSQYNDATRDVTITWMPSDVPAEQNKINAFARSIYRGGYSQELPSFRIANNGVVFGFRLAECSMPDHDMLIHIDNIALHTLEAGESNAR